MRLEIGQLQRCTGIATILVTHDQSEALSMSDRVAVMHAGRIEQAGAPADIYERPDTRFVAQFIGTTTFLPGTAATQAAPGAEADIATPYGPVRCRVPAGCTASQVLALGLRPERLRVLPLSLAAGAGSPGILTLPAIVAQAICLGDRVDLHLRTTADGTPLVAALALAFGQAQPA